jgi:hypothetical protein
MRFYLLGLVQSTGQFGLVSKSSDIPSYEVFGVDSTPLTNNIIIRADDGKQIAFIRGIVDSREIWEICPGCDNSFYATILPRDMGLDDAVSDIRFFEIVKERHPEAYDWLLFNADMIGGKFNLV